MHLQSTVYFYSFPITKGAKRLQHRCCYYVVVCGKLGDYLVKDTTHYGH